MVNGPCSAIIISWFLGPLRASLGPGPINRIWPRGFGGAAPNKIFCDHALSLPENEGNAPLKNNYSKQLLKHSVNQGHHFLLVMNDLPWVSEGMNNSMTPMTDSLGQNQF